MQESSLKIPILPAELITEILLKLPVKSLLQFRCASKSWLSLISTPEFIKAHLSMSANNKDYTHHRLIFVQHDYNVELKGRICTYLKDCTLSNVLDDSVIGAFDLDYPMKNPHKSVEIVGSVNGLICPTIEQEDLFLWNPSIRKFKKLPDFTAKLRLGYCIMYGIGYDEVHDDYKLVCVFRNSSYNISHYVEVNVYSLNSDSWTSINDFHSGEQLIRWGMFMNGKLHWASSTSHDFHSYCGWDISYIDLAHGKWGKMDTPCYGEGDFEFLPCLGVLGSDLSVFCNSRKTYTDVWVMKEYGVKESWTDVYHQLSC
uniref:F-box/kelch-repeat protein At3g23880-like n=1 Tax=Nicotiana tabacum TaxID=4097 RepID=A0A1S4AFU2_TOBAC|nr:PREDICTED: F-box/kelch-repeat protein At3g23880-like [Nicotiana tabacum]